MALRCVIAEQMVITSVIAPENIAMFMLTGATIVPAMNISGAEISIRFPVLTVPLNCRFFTLRAGLQARQCAFCLQRGGNPSPFY